MAYLGLSPASIPFPNTIGTSLIIDGTIGTDDLADGSITTAKIAPGAVIAGRIADSNIITAKLADESVTTAKIADSAITTAKLLNANVTSIKMSNTGVSAATYGNATLIPSFIVDSAGRITGASNVALVIDVNNISGNVRIFGNLRPDIYLETFSNVAISSGNITLNLSNATVFRTVVTGAANVVLQNPPPANVGYSLILQLYRTGSHAITWPTSIQWPNDTAPTLSTTNGYVDTVALYTVDGGVNYYGTSVIGQY